MPNRCGMHCDSLKERFLHPVRFGGTSGNLMNLIKRYHCARLYATK